MEDSRIIELSWKRSERAIVESERKFGGYCYQIAYHILYNREDAEEIVSDTWLGAWNSMPPHKPKMLSAFFGKITRRCSIDRYLLRNSTDSDLTVTAYYPFTGTLNNREGFPEITQNDISVTADLHPGAYSGGFTGAYGDAGNKKTSRQTSYLTG